MWRPHIARHLSTLQARWLRPSQLFGLYAPSRHSHSSPIRLRDYQEECIGAVLNSLMGGSKRVGISLATGSGKTVIFTQLIDRIPAVSANATQTLVLAHRRELVEQAARQCALAYPDKKVEVEMGPLHASGTAEITIASIQSITSKDRLEKFDPERFKLVLVDEAHHIVAPGYLKTLRHFNLDSKNTNSPALVGVSATFSRFDGLRLGAAIDEIVYHKDYVDMIEEKWLADVVFTTVESTADISKVRDGANGDFQTGALSRAVNTEKVNEITVRSWLAKAGDRKSTLVFCVDIAHVESLTRQFRRHGVDARFVKGDTPVLERSECLDSFRRGEFPVLVNCGVFTEGTDIPNVDCIVLARPTKSRNLLVQMIGRGMRLHPGKETCHVLDMVSSLDTGIVSTPTLFGLDPSELVENATAADMRQMREQRKAEPDAPIDWNAPSPTETESEDGLGTGSVTFTEYSSVFDLIADTSGEKHIHTLSKYSWVQAGPGRYVLAAPTGTYLRIEKVEMERQEKSLFRVVEVRALPAGVAKSPYATPRELLLATCLADAVHGADNYASTAFPHTFINRYQRWRSGPPTKGQLEFLNKLRSRETALTELDVTKGQATDMITKIKHGARGRFDDMQSQRRRRERITTKLENEEARRRREKVSVGPVE